jgi:hypothetical protein
MAEVSVVVLLEQARRNREQAHRVRRLAASATDGLVERLERCAGEMESHAAELETRAGELLALSQRSRFLPSEIALLIAQVPETSSQTARLAADAPPAAARDTAPDTPP